MTNFNDIQLFYNKRWATKEHVQQFVELGVITATEYKKITGETFPKKETIGD